MIRQWFRPEWMGKADRLTRLMFRQQYCSYFALVALLLGNVAGLLHVGSHHHHDCCQVVQPSEGQSKQVTTTSRGENSDQHWHCQCQHHAQPSDHPDESLPQRSEDQSSGDTPCDHDSDHCSICQAMAFSFKGSLLDIARVEFDAPDVSTAVDTSYRLQLPATQVAGLFARGPPCV